jgi:hypothetical protein
VVGEASRGGLADPFVQVNPSDLVMQVGRPLLVVPESCSWLDLRSVLVAWKDTAEARRVVNDALPLQASNPADLGCEVVEDEARRPGFVWAGCVRRGCAAWRAAASQQVPGCVACRPGWSAWHRTSALA